MIRPEITAEWARKTAQSVLSTKIENELDKCFDNIESAVKRNDMYCQIGLYPHELTLKELANRGFKTKYVDGDQRDGGYLQISW